MCFVIASNDLTVAVHCLYAVPDLPDRARRRVCPHRAGNDVTATCGDGGDLAAVIRIAPEQKRGGRLRPHHRGKLPALRNAAQVEEEAEITLRGGRLPLRRLRDRRLDDAQRISGFNSRCGRQPKRAQEARHKDQEACCNRRGEASARRKLVERGCSEKGGQRGGEYRQEAQPVNADRCDALQHQNRPGKSARPGVAD